MINNPMKEKLAGGGYVVGSFVNMASPTVVEVLALAGLDFVVVDAEHSTVTPSEAEGMFRAAEAKRVSALTRVGENTQQVIQKFLDAGSLGIQMPLVNTKEEAERLVEAIKYPPVGLRGLATVRAAEFGLGESLGDYVEAANQATLVVAQIETQEGIKHAEDIIEVEGVDVVFLGPTDLSVALGYPGQVTHPEVLRLIEELTQKILKAGKVSGTIVRDPDAYAYWRQRGVRYFMTSATALLGQATRAYVNGIRAIG